MSLRAWVLVLLLTLAYILSFIDRQILSLLITPIKTDLALSDTALGLLLGPAFAIFYVTLGWPIGWLADRANRRNLIAAGVALWSLMTAASGLSRTFGQLFAARIGVGVGEATLTPCALSLIGDSFPESRRGRAVGVYMMGLSLGGGLAYLVGGVVVGAVRTTGPVTIPVLGAVASWQAAFLAVGLPGLVVALAILTLTEPARSTAAEAQAPPMREALRFILQRWRAYGALTFGMSAVVTIAYTGGWNIAYFERTWHWPVAQIALWIGGTMVIIGPLASGLSGVIADTLVRRGVRDGAYRTCICGTLILVVAASLYPLMPSPWLALLVHGIAVFGNAIGSAMGSASIVALAPSRLRALATALYFLGINLVGLMIGPTAVGWLSEHVFTAQDGIGKAMAVVPLAIGIPGLAAFWLGRRAYRAEVATV